MENKSIVLDEVSKVYTLSKASDRITLFEAFRRKQSTTHNKRVKITAIDNVTLSIKQGERIGIIGHNGAGKTTLLQMMAGLAVPSSGSIAVDGHVSCVMTLGIGLREALTGRENIYIDGELNGKLRSETDTVIEKIIEFADLQEFIDLPVRTYSSGMKARLAFSMIVFIEPEILIIDEALSAGDARFSSKASVKMKELCAKGKILIIVSHSMASIVDMCDRCIWLDHGRVLMDGIPEKVTRAYMDAVRELDEEKLRTKFRQRTQKTYSRTGFSVSSLVLRSEDAQESRTIFMVDETIVIDFSIHAQRTIASPDIRLIIDRTDGIRVFDNYATTDGLSIANLDGDMSLQVSLGDLRLGKCVYELTIQLLELPKTPSSIVAEAKGVFQVENMNYPHSNPICWLPTSWKFVE